MALPTFPFLGPFGGPNPSSTLPNNFTAGVSVGPSFGAATGGNSVPAQDGLKPKDFPAPQLEKWGGALPLAPVVSYRISPFCAALDALVATVDICTFTAGQSDIEKAVFTPASLVPNGGTTWLVTLPDGTQGLRLDWPRALGITTVGSTNVSGATVLQVYGYDFYGNQMQASYTNFGGVNTAINTAFQYSPYTDTATPPPAQFPQEPAPNAAPSFTNKAFWIITRVALSGAAVPAATTINMVTTRQMGLPYVYYPAQDVLLGVNWNGFTELSGSLGALSTYTPGVPLQLANGTAWGAGGSIPTGGVLPQQAFFAPADFGEVPSATNLDVRGTYSPSYAVRGGTPKLSVVWLQSSGDVMQNLFSEAYMSDPGGSPVAGQGSRVAPINSGDRYGQPQYFESFSS